jgi:predicted permease
MVVARLAPGSDPHTANTEIAGIMERQVQAIPDFNTGWIAQAIPLADNLREPLRLPLSALAGAVLIVLLIVSINTSSLLLSRNLGRLEELSLRRALGAGRGRLNRQLLTEGVLIAASAAGLGWLIASRLRPLVAGLLPEHLAASASPPPGWLLPATLGATLLCVMMCSWLPSLPALQSVSRLAHGRSLGGARSQHRLRAALVFAQTALALVLLVGSALMLQTVHRLLAVDPGFDTDGIVGFTVGLPRQTEPARVRTFYGELVEQLAALPGVETAGAIGHAPMAGAGPATSFAALDRPEPDDGDWPVADIRTIEGDAFAALGVDLIEGRRFDSSDATDPDIGSVVVSRILADDLWPGGDAVGQELTVHWGNSQRKRRIVGVVEDVHLVAPESSPRGTIYFPQRQESQQAMSLILRTSRDLESISPEMRSVVAALDPTLPVFDLFTIRGLVRGTLADRQFLSRVMTGFAMLSFALSVLGIYGVTAISITESRQEVGLRVALGARPWEVIGLFVGRVAKWTAAALAAGLIAAVLAGRAVEGLFFGVEATDPSVLAGMALLVATAAILAAAIPARRAARMDPSHALRTD